MQVHVLRYLDERKRIIRKKNEGAKFMYAPVLYWHYNADLGDEVKSISDKMSYKLF